MLDTTQILLKISIIFVIHFCVMLVVYWVFLSLQHCFNKCLDWTRGAIEQTALYRRMQQRVAQEEDRRQEHVMQHLMFRYNTATRFAQEIQREIDDSDPDEDPVRITFDRSTEARLARVEQRLAEIQRMLLYVPPKSAYKRGPGGI